MTQMKLVAVLLGTVFAVKCSADIAVTMHQPPYWSGTHCRALGSATYAGPEGIKSLKLYIGGVEVKKQYWPYGELMQHGTISAWFDSTNFPPFQDLTVAVAAEAWNGSYHYSPHVRLVKNAVRTYDTKKWATGAAHNGGNVWAWNLSTKYRAHINLTNNWTSQKIHDDISDDTNVVYVNHHGYSSSIGTPMPAGYWPYDAHQTDEQGFREFMYSTVAQANAPPTQNTRMSYEKSAKDAVGATSSGSTLPPFNPTGHPPMSLLWLDTCDCGMNNSFSAALWPFYTFYSPTTVKNRAVVGFSVRTGSQFAQATARVVIRELAGEKVTVGEAVDKMVVKGVMGTPWPYPPGWRPIYQSEVHVYGDKMTRIHGVYTGDTTKKKDWWY